VAPGSGSGTGSGIDTGTGSAIDTGSGSGIGGGSGSGMVHQPIGVRVCALFCFVAVTVAGWQ
jgi:hypothetical protein